MLLCPRQCLHVVTVVGCGCVDVIVVKFLCFSQFVVLCIVCDELMRVPLLSQPVRGIQQRLLLPVIKPVVHYPTLVLLA